MRSVQKLLEDLSNSLRLVWTGFFFWCELSGQNLTKQWLSLKLIIKINILYTLSANIWPHTNSLQFQPNWDGGAVGFIIIIIIILASGTVVSLVLLQNGWDGGATATQGPWGLKALVGGAADGGQAHGGRRHARNVVQAARLLIARRGCGFEGTEPKKQGWFKSPGNHNQQQWKELMIKWQEKKTLKIKTITIQMAFKKPNYTVK